LRVKITLEYDGSKFQGYQIQKEIKNTISQKLQDAFYMLNIISKAVASGRTDRGVHATGQVLHIDLPDFWKDLNKLAYSLNTILHPSIRIKKIEYVSDDFHARFCAKKRVYRYIVSIKKPTVFLNPYVTFIKSLDTKSIKESIKLFEGEHDFEYFKKTGSDTKNYTREIYKADFYKYKDFYIFYFEANGFLRSQIRMMVSFLLHISDGKLSKNELKLQLEKKGIFSTSLAPPNGLYLAKIKYR
jgi:tRNA pseudouridine38-40 synthase